MLATLLLIHSVTLPGAVSGVDLATQVGRPYDSAAVAKDVRTLWNSGRFQDIRVETIERPESADIIFHIAIPGRKIASAAGRFPRIRPPITHRIPQQDS